MLAYPVSTTIRILASHARSGSTRVRPSSVASLRSTIAAFGRRARAAASAVSTVWATAATQPRRSSACASVSANRRSSSITSTEGGASAGIGEQLVERQMDVRLDAAQRPALELEAPAEALQRRAGEQDADAEPAVLRGDHLEPDLVAQGRVQAHAVVDDVDLELAAVAPHAHVDAAAAVRAARVRRVVEHVANRLADRGLGDDRRVVGRQVERGAELDVGMHR